MTNCHCIAHRLNLAGKDSAKDIPYFEDYEVTLKEIYNYFVSSHQRWQHLKIFQNLDEENSQLSVLRVVNTRWLSLSNAISNLHQIIFSVIDALEDDMNNNTCNKTRQRAQRIYEDLDSEFILATKFLADILFTFSNLTKIFQSDYVALSDVHVQLNTTIDSITTEFIGSGDDPNEIDYISPTYKNHLQTYICLIMLLNLMCYQRHLRNLLLH
jgi:hypothetical protein